MAITLDGSNGVKSTKLTSNRDPNYVYLDFVDSATANDTNGDMVLSAYFPIVFKTDLEHERMRIDRQGRVTMPYQPAFLARGDGLATCNGNYADLVYTTVTHNTGGHYNSSTGRFTAPVSGYYLITGHLVPTGNVQNATSEFFIIINGNTSNRVFLDRRKKIEATSSNTFSMGGSAITYLNANDYVTLSTVAVTSTATIEASSAFSGHLIG
jgi:hypothetical protein